MAHDVVHQEVKIVSGPFLPLCQLWSPQDRLHVSDVAEECALALEPLLAGIFFQLVLLTKLVPHREFHCHAKSPLISAHSHH